MASAAMSTARIVSARPSTARKPFSAARPARAVRVVAAAQENQGPKDAVMKTFGALAAVQLALLPIAGTAIADIIPNKAERAEINQRTSNLPTIGDVGDSLKKNLGQNDPKDIGRAIDRNTPDVDLTKNPKDLGRDAINKAKNVASDLSDLPNLTKQPNFFKGEGEVNARKEIQDKLKGAGSEIGKGLPNLPNLSGNPAEKAADKAQSLGKDAVSKAKNVASDLSDLPNLTKQPNFFKGEGEVNARKEIQDKVKNAGSDIGKGLPNLSGNPAQKAADKVQGAANKAKNAVSDLSDLPNPFKGNANPQSLANDAKNKAKSLTNEVGKNIPNAGDAKRAIDKNTPNLPNLGGSNLPGQGQGKGSLNIPRNS